MASAGAEAPAVAGASRGRHDSRTARGLLWIRDWIRVSDVRTALALGALALVVRVIWVVSVTRHGYAANDSLFYGTVAHNLATGRGFTFLNGVPTAQWPPVYPFLLSVVFTVFGSAQRAGQLLNATIGAASVPVLFLIARRTFGRREAVLAAALLALFPTQIFLTDVLISETLDVFLLLCVFALLTLLRPTRGAAVAIGLLIGICTLTRGENALLVAVPLAVWWRALSPRLRLNRLVILIAAVALVVTPWAVRNAERLHAAVLVSTNAGQTLYAGHNPHANGYAMLAPESVVAKQLREPQPRREVDLNRTLTHYAEHWAIRHPLQELLLIPKRFSAFVGDDSDLFLLWVIPDGTSKPTIGPDGARRLALLTTLTWGALLAAFIGTVVLAGRRLWKSVGSASPLPIIRGALIWMAITTVLYSVFFVGGFRYHVALEPLMILTMAPALCGAWSARRQLGARFISGPS